MYLQSEVYKKRVETSVLAINVLKSRAYIPELLFVRVHMPKYLTLSTDALREASLHKRAR